MTDYADKEKDDLQREFLKAISRETGIPLDDLLMPNDAAYEPPENIGEIFERGGAFWEGICDRWKWPEKGIDFHFGYTAAMFDTALKTGKPFRMPVSKGRDEMFIARAAQYGRRCERDVDGPGLCLSVYPRGE